MRELFEGYADDVFARAPRNSSVRRLLLEGGVLIADRTKHRAPFHIFEQEPDASRGRQGIESVYAKILRKSLVPTILRGHC